MHRARPSAAAATSRGLQPPTLSGNVMAGITSTQREQFGGTGRRPVLGSPNTMPAYTRL